MTLICDGYSVTLMLERVSKYKMGITVYVNGFLKVKWLGVGGDEPSDEGIRFYPIKSRYIHKRTTRDAYTKLSKQSKIALGWKINEKHTYRGVYWGSFKLMKSHFIKHNQSIELVRHIAAYEINEDSIIELNND